MTENNLNPVDEIPTIPVVENSRPQRARHIPDRPTYYNPGETEPFRVFPISATVWRGNVLECVNVLIYLSLVYEPNPLT